jgi:molybdenum cofactor cytidylyltransferase
MTYEPIVSRLEPPVPAIVLAAGASRRLGRPKQLVVVEGETLLRRTVRAALATCAPVLVVVGARAREVEASLAGLPVRVVSNPGWEEGMASSIRAGVRALPQGTTAALFLVCDQLAVDRALVARVLAAGQDHPGAVVACAYGQGLGIPALFPARCFPQLLALTGDRGAKALLDVPGVVAVPFPAGSEDVDSPEDLPTDR